jgi:hypothetical protein
MDMCRILEPKPQREKVVAPQLFAQGTIKEHFFLASTAKIRRVKALYRI